MIASNYMYVSYDCECVYVCDGDGGTELIYLFPHQDGFKLCCTNISKIVINYYQHLTEQNYRFRVESHSVNGSKVKNSNRLALNRTSSTPSHFSHSHTLI